MNEKLTAGFSLHLASHKRGLATVQNFEIAGLGHGPLMLKGFLHEVLIREVFVGDEPEVSRGAEGLGSDGDELEAQHGVGLAAIMKGRIHDDGVIARVADSLSDVFPQDAWTHRHWNEARIPSGTLKRTCIGLIHVHTAEIWAMPQDVVAEVTPAGA